LTDVFVGDEVSTSVEEKKMVCFTIGGRPSSGCRSVGLSPPERNIVLRKHSVIGEECE
jgi:hypothetical protein